MQPSIASGFMLFVIYLATDCREEVVQVVKKFLTWGGIAFLIFFIAYRPQSAAGVFQSIGGGIMDIATGFGDFFTSLLTRS